MALGMARANVSKNPDLIPVLLEIVIDTAKTKHAFANISRYNHFSTENEILTDIGAILSINEVILRTPGTYVNQCKWFLIENASETRLLRVKSKGQTQEPRPQ